MLGVEMAGSYKTLENGLAMFVNLLELSIRIKALIAKRCLLVFMRYRCVAVTG